LDSQFRGKHGINTDTGCELGRYRTGPGTGGAENPSRTTVDTNGDLWLGNRNSNTAVKIALEPIDLNNDGSVTTSQDLNDNCTIEPSEVLPWGKDEAILLRIPVDSGPRALGIDAHNNVWIGGYGQNMGYYDGKTGEKLKNIFVGKKCYGALVDSQGTLWISGRPSYLVRIDNPDGEHTKTDIPAYQIYGMSIDQEGYIYSSSWEGRLIRKYDPINKRWAYQTPLESNGRGVTVGVDGDVWVAQSLAKVISRHDAATGNVKATVPVGIDPTGVATAADGKIWVTNRGSHNVMRIDPATNTVDFTHGSHPDPYNYSDMTGIISRSITTQKGTWTVVSDEGTPSICKATVSWHDELPVDSTITVAAASSVDGESWNAFQPVQSSIEFSTVGNAAYIKVVAEFTASMEEHISPILYDLTINTTPCQPPIAICKEQVINADKQCLGHASVNAGSYDPDGEPWTIKETPEGLFPLGTTEVTLTITDFLDETDSCSANVIVVDQTPPLCDHKASGTIYDKLGNPLEGVTVQVDGRMTVTDEAGNWDINGLPAGTYDVIAKKEDYIFPLKTCVIGNQEKICTPKIIPSSTLEISMVSQPRGIIKQGENITYTMTITNGGTKTATDIVFKDILPEGSHIVSFEALDGGSCDTNTIICSLPDLTPGAIAQIKLVVSNTQSNKLENTVRGFCFSEKNRNLEHRHLE
jgi:uncharacterized repeat protein (TIGR01451 family)